MASVPFCNLEDTFNMTDWEKKQNSQLLNTFRNSNTCVSRNNSYQNQIAKNQFGLPANPLNVGQNLDQLKKPEPEQPQQMQQNIQKPVQMMQQPQQGSQISMQPMQQMYQYVPVMPYYTCPERVPLYYQQYQQWPQQLALPQRWGLSGPRGYQQQGYQGPRNNMNIGRRTVESFDNYGSYGSYDNAGNGDKIMKYILFTILVIYGIYLLFDIMRE